MSTDIHTRTNARIKNAVMYYVTLSSAQVFVRITVDIVVLGTKADMCIDHVIINSVLLLSCFHYHSRRHCDIYLTLVLT